MKHDMNAKKGGEYEGTEELHQEVLELLEQIAQRESGRGGRLPPMISLEEMQKLTEYRHKGGVLSHDALRACAWWGLRLATEWEDVTTSRIFEAIDDEVYVMREGDKAAREARAQARAQSMDDQEEERVADLARETTQNKLYMYGRKLTIMQQLEQAARILNEDPEVMPLTAPLSVDPPTGREKGPIYRPGGGGRYVYGGAQHERRLMAPARKNKPVFAVIDAATGRGVVAGVRIEIKEEDEE